MRRIGFSTGAIAPGDVRRALAMLEGSSTNAVELSALRLHELTPVLEALPSLDLSPFAYVSFHAPSRFAADEEAGVARSLEALIPLGWPIILHPDTIHDFNVWRPFGAQLCIENMDKRKPIGRTLPEIARVFEELPEASFCFDIGHARQVDRTMTEAHFLISELGRRLCQVHVSELSAACRHDPLSFAAVSSFRKVAPWVPYAAPLILETPASEGELERQIAMVKNALPG
jgi:hypothetical protein